VGQLKCASLGQAQALPANITLGWKRLKGTHIQKFSKLHKEKKFYNIGLHYPYGFHCGYSIVVELRPCKPYNIGQKKHNSEIS
jgi:hypothetical protein